MGLPHRGLMQGLFLSLLTAAVAEGKGEGSERSAEFIQWAEELAHKSTHKKEPEMGTENTEKKCRMSNMDEDDALVVYPKVLCFVSFSMPIEGLVELSKEMQKIGGALIIRGLPKDSFSTFSKKLIQLRKKGAFAPILIDPKAFETYQIEHVPTFVVFNEKHYDKISGNISVDHVLTRFIAEGDTSPSFEKFLSQEEQ
ncbi:MAG: hypothetical protein K1000chlam3_00468 [Chlamydiae bacterium]|nr:hypothetical protein [Chlamydiota bacterium]